MPIENLTAQEFSETIKNIEQDRDPFVSLFASDLMEISFNKWQQYKNADTGVATLTDAQKAEMTDQLWAGAVKNITEKYFGVSAAAATQINGARCPAGTNMFEEYLPIHLGMTKNQMRGLIDIITKRGLSAFNLKECIKPMYGGHKEKYLKSMYGKYTEDDGRVMALHDYTDVLQQQTLPPEDRETTPFRSREQTQERHYSLIKAVPFVPPEENEL